MLLAVYLYPQQEGYELLEAHDGQGALVIVDYLVKTALGNLQVCRCLDPHSLHVLVYPRPTLPVQL